MARAAEPETSVGASLPPPLLPVLLGFFFLQLRPSVYGLTRRRQIGKEKRKTIVSLITRSANAADRLAAAILFRLSF